MFVADPKKAPPHKSIIYKRPDDLAHSGLSWREELNKYNRKYNRDPLNNPLRLLPAWRLYEPRPPYRNIYRKLVKVFGTKNVFILSAGWGLISACFLTPDYDITFSPEAAKKKPCARRRKQDENLYDTRKTMLRDAEFARQEAELHSPAAEEYEAGAQALSDYVESLLLILKRETDELALSELPALKESEAALDDAKELADGARHALENARAELSGPEKVLGGLQTELGTAAARHEDAKQRLARLRSQLEDAEKQCPGDELLANIEVARAELSEREKAVAELGAERTDETLDQLQARIDHLEKSIGDRREKRGNLEVEISGLKSHVGALEGGGLDEEISQKDRELELCREELRRSRREVDVLTLLLSTLRDAEREAKERYMSPVVNRLRPYLRLLFPGADITIDENLEITGVVREGGYEESFDHLSMGTQEQIAVLVRLAFAEMLVEQGQPATVVLDDALVFSDDRRMDRMFDILNMAAKNIQVLIFTCREQLFEGIGGCHLSLEPGEAEELMSA